MILIRLTLTSFLYLVLIMELVLKILINTCFEVKNNFFLIIFNNELRTLKCKNFKIGCEKSFFIKKIKKKIDDRVLINFFKGVRTKK